MWDVFVLLKYHFNFLTLLGHCKNSFRERGAIRFSRHIHQYNSNEDRSDFLGFNSSKGTEPILHGLNNLLFVFNDIVSRDIDYRIRKNTKKSIFANLGHWTYKDAMVLDVNDSRIISLIE